MLEVDFDNSVLELDTTDNNIAVTRIFVPTPPPTPEPDSIPLVNLVCSDISYDVTDLRAGNFVQFSSDVTNTGTGSSGSFEIKWFMDGVTIEEYFIYSLAAGQSITSKCEPLMYPGDYPVKIEVGSDGIMYDYKEAPIHVNSTTTTTTTTSTVATTTTSASSPKLEVTYLDCRTSPMYVGNTYTFNATIKNMGSTPVSNISVDWSVDGSFKRTSKIGLLPGNQSTTVSYSWHAVYGYHTIKASPDHNGKSKSVEKFVNIN